MVKKYELATDSVRAYRGSGVQKEKEKPKRKRSPVNCFSAFKFPPIHTLRHGFVGREGFPFVREAAATHPLPDPIRQTEEGGREREGVRGRKRWEGKTD